MAGLRVLPQIGVYAMSKAAVVHMTRAMALEWGRFGINVNAMCPGYIDTEINHHHWQTEQGQKLMQMLPRKRVGQPQDLDAVLMMLLQPEPLRQRRGDLGGRRVCLLSAAVLTGIVAGVAAGALWGLVFVAPRMVPGFIGRSRRPGASWPTARWRGGDAARPATRRLPTSRQALAALGHEHPRIHRLLPAAGAGDP